MGKANNHVLFKERYYNPRIIGLDARKAQQARNKKKKDNVICEMMDREELDKGQNIY